jgi:hypothetical protein
MRSLKSLRSVGNNLKKNTIGSMLILLLVVFVGGFLLNMLMGGSLFNNGMVEGNENMKHKLTYYYMNKCPHCVKFTPIWDKFVSKNARDDLTYNKVEASSGNIPESVEGYPTIILVKKDSSAEIVHNGERTAAGLTSFLNANGL